MVVVELEPPSQAGPRGRVVEILGNPEVPGVDVRAVLRHHGIEDGFAQEALAAADSLPENPGEDEIQGREDLTRQVLVTIDGASARDFDDAVSLERLGDGLLRLGVHIADVSSYVTEGSLLDLAAFARGTSVYFPDRAVPMLPERLSNGLCSLRPEVPRLAVSAFLDIDREGTVVRQRFAETVIRSRRRLTYEEVRRLLEEPRSEDRKEYGKVLDLLDGLRELMGALNRARVARGSIDFDLPAGDVILDTDGYVVGVKPQERTVAHRIIEECMIAANEAVARELFEAEVSALYRVHEAPDVRHLEDLREILEPLGVSLEGELENLHPDRLQAVLRQVEGTPEEAFVTTLVLRAMDRAFYHRECRGHYALASRHYTHFTSPIRRYPDLVVHRRLKAHLRGEAVAEAESSAFDERLDGIAEHSSFTERRAEQAERDILQWKKVRFLTHRVGETFPGRITGVQPFGLFVQLDDLYVDGLIHIGTLDDYFVFEAESHRLVGQNEGKVFQLADRVEVKLTGVDQRNRGLILELVGPDLRASRRRQRRSARRGG
jgi:ribonuclease R